MCRWLAYSGGPVLLADLLYKPEHSLIDQSFGARLGVRTTNGDGFGVGWYGEGGTPALFKDVDPIWNDRNLIELSEQIRSPLIFSHIRASTGTPVQQTNCHPFRFGKWLWMHNGQIAGFRDVKRELVLAVEPRLYPYIEGSTDSETFFFLALTFGLENDPPQAVARAVGFIETTCRAHGLEKGIRMSVAVSDGQSMWVFRYTTKSDLPSLFFSTKVETLRKQYPEVKAFQSFTEETRLVVSEPLSELAGVWNEVPASSYAVVAPGEDKLFPFVPTNP
jgi:glutamine amidotransferase